AERLDGQTVPGALAALNLAGGSQGLLEGLRMMRQMLPVLSAGGPLGAMATGRDSMWTQVSAAMGRLQQGRAGAPVDFSAMAQAVRGGVRKGRAALRDRVSHREGGAGGAPAAVGRGAPPDGQPRAGPGRTCAAHRRTAGVGAPAADIG